MPRDRFGFFPAPGTDYSRGAEPEIARRLGRLARALHLHLIGISGYRTPQHSIAVGGFANDPHTRGQASDTPGIENVPESALRRYGLTRPFSGTREANHIQLLSGGSSRPTRVSRTDGPAQWLAQAGWPSRLIPIMVAIGGAESRWQVDAESPPNTDGSVDYGWLQVNSTHGYDPARLKSDPVYEARAAKEIYRTQGLNAWTTYRTGAYKAFMGQQPTVGFGRTRPGGETAADTPTPDTELVAFWDHLDVPNPLDAFKSAGKAINGVTDFLKWIAWIFHPLNILRVVEFQVGFPLMLAGIFIMVRVWAAGATETSMNLAGKAIQLTPAGRTLRMAKGRRIGKQRAELRKGVRDGETSV